jgi:hypothetical protein
MPKHEDLQFLEVAGTKPQNNQLKNSLRPNVADGQKHDASAIRIRPLFYASLNLCTLQQEKGNDPITISCAERNA